MSILIKDSLKEIKEIIINEHSKDNSFIGLIDPSNNLNKFAINNDIIIYEYCDNENLKDDIIELFEDVNNSGDTFESTIILNVSFIKDINEREYFINTIKELNPCVYQLVITNI